MDWKRERDFFCRGHEMMDEVLSADPICKRMTRRTENEYGCVSCIVFNFGYLPGGSHEFATKGSYKCGSN